MQQQWKEVKGASHQTSPPSQMNYGVAAVIRRSGKLMVLSGLVLARIRLTFIPADNLRAVGSVMSPDRVQTARGYEPRCERKTGAFNMKPHIIGALTADQVIACCCRVKHPSHHHLQFPKFLISIPGKCRCNHVHLTQVLKSWYLT